MLNILSPHWVLRCRNLVQKQALVDYAAAAGLPIGAQHLPTHHVRDSGDLDLGTAFGVLISYAHNPAEDAPELEYWLEPQFRAACDRYARTAAHGND